MNIVAKVGKSENSKSLIGRTQVFIILSFVLCMSFFFLWKGNIILKILEPFGSACMKLGRNKYSINRKNLKKIKERL